MECDLSEALQRWEMTGNAARKPTGFPFMRDADVADANVPQLLAAVPTHISPNPISAGLLCVSAGACADTILPLTFSM